MLKKQQYVLQQNAPSEKDCLSCLHSYLCFLLPGLDGLEVYKKIRGNFNGAMLMLTARDDDIDQIMGLELGVDDYVINH